MSRNIILKDLAKPEEIKVLTDYLKEAFENGDVIYTTSAPNGSISAVRGKFALYLNGSTYELWQNTNGGTTWQRIDAGLSIPLTYLDTDGTLAANSDVKVASQKATKTYVDTKVPVPLTAPLGGTGSTAAANAASGVVVLNASSQLPAVSGALLTEVVPGDASVTGVKLPPTVAGSYSICKATTERTVSNATYTKIKEIKINRAGVLTIVFTLKGDGSALGKIYRNGVAVGTEQAESGTGYNTFSEDISGWSVGDLVQLYIRDPSATAAYSNLLEIRVTTPLEAGTLINYD